MSDTEGFSHPCNNAVLTGTFAAPLLACAELGRFVLLDEVPANGESWFLGRCFELLRREGIIGVVSFADPQHGMQWLEKATAHGHRDAQCQLGLACHIGPTVAQNRELAFLLA